MKQGFVTIPITNLIKAEWNYKYEDEVIKEKLKENIKRNGLIENLIVREIDKDKFEVINGNHRLDVLLELNYKEAMCYNLGKVEDYIAKRIAIETNETKFVADPNKLSEILKDLTDNISIDDLLETLPFTSGELESLTSDLDFNDFEPPSVTYKPETDFVDKPSNKTTNSKEKVTCPNCGYKFRL